MTCLFVMSIVTTILLGVTGFGFVCGFAALLLTWKVGFFSSFRITLFIYSENRLSVTRLSSEK